MGCVDPKEKIENEMIKMKMERSEIQMERQNQLKLLKEIDGFDIKIQKIPDYIDLNSNERQETKRTKKIETESVNKRNKMLSKTKLKLRKCSKSYNQKSNRSSKKIIGRKKSN